MEDIFNYFIIAMIIIFPLGIYIFFIIDKLIKRLYTTFNDEWINAGRPCGLLYFPTGSKNLKSLISLQLNIYSWLFSTPIWIKNDLLSLSYLKKLRLSLIVINISMIIIFILIFIQVIYLVQ